MIGILIARNEEKKDLIESPYFILYSLGMCMICFGTQKDSEIMLDMTQLSEFSEDMKLYLKTLMTACAYAGSGNVLKVQEMMLLVAKPKEQIHNKNQSLAVLSISLIAMGEEVGSEMLFRSFDHFIQYGDVSVKRAISLSMALLSLSNPKITVSDILTKLSYESNKEVATNAIFSIGLISCGTNNARMATNLRQIAAYYSEDQTILQVVRIAQGMLHMGKGLLTINPINSNNLLVNNVGLAGILITILSFTEVNTLFLDKHQYLCYTLCLAMNPRMLMLVDSNLEPKNIQVYVGQSVDTVGQVGNPRTITGFQTHNSPVILAYGERCELGSDEFISCSEVLENVVIVNENKESRQRGTSVSFK